MFASHHEMPVCWTVCFSWGHLTMEKWAHLPTRCYQHSECRWNWNRSPVAICPWRNMFSWVIQNTSHSLEDLCTLTVPLYKGDDDKGRLNLLLNCCSVESLHVEFFHLKSRRCETTDPNEGLPTCSTVLSFVPLKRKKIHVGLLPCQTKLEV